MIGQRNCETCFRIRVFLGIALGLIIMIYLQPAAATRMAELTPSSGFIAGAMMVAGVVGFVIKYRKWVASGRK